MVVNQNILVWSTFRMDMTVTWNAHVKVTGSLSLESPPYNIDSTVKQKVDA